MIIFLKFKKLLKKWNSLTHVRSVVEQCFLFLNMSILYILAFSVRFNKKPRGDIAKFLTHDIATV